MVGLAGRDAEIAELEAALTGAAEHGAALLVIGEAGIGETSLLDAAVGQARSRGYRSEATRREAAHDARRGEEVIEIVGVLLLAVAAVATAWGGSAHRGDQTDVARQLPSTRLAGSRWTSARCEAAFSRDRCDHFLGPELAV